MTANIEIPVAMLRLGERENEARDSANVTPATPAHPSMIEKLSFGQKAHDEGRRQRNHCQSQTVDPKETVTTRASR